MVVFDDGRNHITSIAKLKATPNPISAAARVVAKEIRIKGVNLVLRLMFDHKTGRVSLLDVAGRVLDDEIIAGPRKCVNPLQHARDVDMRIFDE